MVRSVGTIIIWPVPSFEGPDKVEMETADDADEVTTVVVMAQSLLELAYAGRRNFVNDALFFGAN